LRKRRDQRVCRLQDPAAGPEVRIQRQLLCRGAVGLSEASGEFEQVVEAGTAPRVDVLVGIADRRDGVPRGEDAFEQSCLGDVRVLVLVEQNGREAPPVLLADLGMVPDDAGGERDLVSEIDHAELPLQFLEPRDGVGELDAFLRRSVRAIGTVLGECFEPFLVELDDLVGLDKVILRLVGQVEDVADDRGLPLARQVFERHQIEHTRAELDPLCRRQHALARLDAVEHAVAFEQLLGEPVVVGDLGLLTLLQPQRRERLADPEDEVLRGLIREREAQHVAGEGAFGSVAVGASEREPDHARGHHRRLARSGAGNDDARLERPRDGAPLFLRRLRADELDDLARDQVVCRACHLVATPCAGARSASGTGKTG